MSLNAKDLKKIVKEVTEAIVSDENYISSLVKIVSEHLNSKMDEVLENQKKKFDEYEKRIQLLEETNAALQQRANHQEQELKRNNIRIFGIVEGPEENVEDILQNLLNKNLKLKLNVNTTVEKCYRIGQQTSTADNVAKSNTKPRPIFVKFVNYRDKQKVIENRKLLKSSGVVIREELTKAKNDLVKKAINKFTPRNVWTRDGRIFAIKNGKKIIVNSEYDLEENN